MGEGRIQGGDESGTKQRLTIDQAADQLGVTVDAIRSRVKRRTIDHVREGGRVYILLGSDQTATRRDQDTDQESEVVKVLREQLEAEREANREMRRLLAGLIERVPQLEAPTGAPSEPRESTQGAGEEPTGTSPPEPQEATSRPWWRRMFGT